MELNADSSYYSIPSHTKIDDDLQQRSDLDLFGCRCHLKFEFRPSSIIMAHLSFPAADKKVLALFDVDNTLSKARKVYLDPLTSYYQAHTPIASYARDARSA